MLSKGTFYYETDYTMFVNTVMNRAIDKNHVKKLVKSFAEIGQVQAIICVNFNNKYHVIDGGHRLEACKIAKLPVKFDKIKDVKTTQEFVQLMSALNGYKKPMGIKDFDNIWAADGNQNYVEVQKFSQKHPDFNKTFGVYPMVLAMGGGSGWTTKFFNTGKFILGDVATAESFIKDLISLKPYFPKYYTNTKFIIAFMYYWNQFNYDHKVMLKASADKNFQYIFNGIGNIFVFKEKISKLYNSKVRGDKKLF